MIVKQIYTQCLAQASYYIESDGESVVIDPIRDIDSYVNLLDINNSKLKFILETHFHADFISGHLELNKKYGVPIIFSHNAEPAYNFFQIYIPISIFINSLNKIVRWLGYIRTN